MAFKIVFSGNMKKQLQPPRPRIKHKTYRQAYNYVLSRWGSGSLEFNNSTPRMGCSIHKIG